MGSPLPFVSVIVPVRNGERTIGACLESLLRMDYPQERREILVVDNGSTDRTAEIVATYPVTMLREPQRGAAAARNRGIEASRGELLAFTDADCVVTTRWLRELFCGFADETVGGVEGETIDYPPLTPAEQYMARRRGYSYQVRRMSPLAPYVVTANVAFRREVFRLIGLFDTRFDSAGGEDVDLTWRFLRDAGLALRYNPKGIVFHHHRQTARGYLSQQLRNGRGLALLRAKYPGRLPWNWRQELEAWVRVALSAGVAGWAAVRYAVRGGDVMDAYYPYFLFLGRLGIRAGFLRETLVGR